MRRESKTQYAVLGLLSIEPMSGYDMKSFISNSIGFFWQESYGQIYPVLRKLLREGSIKRKVVEHDGRPDRHIHSLTPKGKEKLLKWLESPTEPESLRIEMLLKLFFGGLADPGTSIRHLEQLLEEQSARMRTFTKADRNLRHDDIQDDDFEYQYATLRYGIHITAARIKWCRETIESLKKSSKRTRKTKTTQHT